jgi:hypothetical protein
MQVEIFGVQLGVASYSEYADLQHAAQAVMLTLWCSGMALSRQSLLAPSTGTSGKLSFMQQRTVAFHAILTWCPSLLHTLMTSDYVAAYTTA